MLSTETTQQEQEEMKPWSWDLIVTANMAHTGTLSEAEDVEDGSR